MVLRRSAFGAEYGAFLQSPACGFQDNTLYAESTLNPGDSAADIGDGGRITGYSLSFQNPRPSEDTQVIGSRVDLFAEADQAANALEEGISDLEDTVGKSMDRDVTVGEVRSDTVAGLENGRWYVGSFEVGDRVLYAEVIEFTIGRLRAGVQLTRLDDEDAKENLRVLADDLDQRIRLVLRNGAQNPIDVCERGDPDETPQDLEASILRVT